MSAEKFTKGPWVADKHDGKFLITADRPPMISGPVGVAVAYREADARLVAAAPMLQVIADLTGLYAWESLSENFHQKLTQCRKAELLSAYRAFAGYRDGRLTAEQAWEELEPARKALAGTKGPANG